MMLSQQHKFIPGRSVKSLLVSAVFATVSLFCSGKSLAEEIMTVSVGAAGRATIYDHVAVVGTLVAQEEIRVNALVEGKEVREILVDVGEVVTKGQPLAILDAAEANLMLDRNTVQHSRAAAAVAQEHSRVDVASINQREARKVVERSRSLVGRGVVAQQRLDEHENALSRANALLELAQQSLMLAEADRELIARERAEIALTIERSTVRATEAGKVLSRDARIGAKTSASAPPLFILARDGLIEMEASVSEASFVRLQEGMVAEVNAAGQTQKTRGRVRLTAAQIDPLTRMGTVRLALDQSQTLVPGAFVHGRIEVARRSNVTVPTSAVRIQNGEVSVFVVEHNQAVLRAITLGSPTGAMVEVLSGVKEGEIIVTKSGGFLKTDERILTVPTAGLDSGKLSSLEVEGRVAR
jgi:HlyD family secretion protein